MRRGLRGGRIAAWSALPILVLVVTGCATGGPQTTPTPSYSSTYVAPPATELAPLTGEVIPAGSLTTPSLAAKVDNHEEARPQVGLERTDLVFEELVEGGLTASTGRTGDDGPQTSP